MLDYNSTDWSKFAEWEYGFPLTITGSMSS